MTNAKQCDRCNDFFKDEDFTSMPYKISAVDKEQRDLCKNCLYELEEWMDNPKKKKIRKKSEWSEKHLQEAAQRQSTRIEIAKLLQQNSGGMEWREAVAKGALRIRKAKEQEISVEQLKESIMRATQHNRDNKKTSLCPMCDKNKVRTEGDMCEKCLKDWNEYEKNK